MPIRQQSDIQLLFPHLLLRDIDSGWLSDNFDQYRIGWVGRVIHNSGPNGQHQGFVVELEIGHGLVDSLPFEFVSSNLRPTFPVWSLEGN